MLSKTIGDTTFSNFPSCNESALKNTTEMVFTTSVSGNDDDGLRMVFCSGFLISPSFFFSPPEEQLTRLE